MCKIWVCCHVPVELPIKGAASIPLKLMPLGNSVSCVVDETCLLMFAVGMDLLFLLM